MLDAILRVGKRAMDNASLPECLAEVVRLEQCVSRTDAYQSLRCAAANRCKSRCRYRFDQWSQFHLARLVRWIKRRNRNPHICPGNTKLSACSVSHLPNATGHVNPPFSKWLTETLQTYALGVNSKQATVPASSGCSSISMPTTAALCDLILVVVLSEAFRNS